MAESFAISRDDVRLVVVHDSAAGRSRIVAIDASPNGHHAGVYDRIMAERRDDPSFLTIEVDGETVDVLPASTEDAYRAMIEDARHRGRLLPDSLALSQQNDELWTATMLMGEPLMEDGLVPLLSVSGSTVNKVGFHRNRGGRSIRVRPAVVVAEIEKNRHRSTARRPPGSPGAP